MLQHLLLIILLVGSTTACTEFIVRGTEDESIILARSMDFDIVQPYGVQFVPEGTSYKGMVHEACQGTVEWENRFDTFVARPLPDKLHMISPDGINDAGLSAASLYLDFFTEYPNITADDCGNVVCAYELVRYVLARFGTVKEVLAEIKADKFPLVWGFPVFGSVHPLHYAITDKSGESIIIEYAKGGLKVHHNTLGVLANDPNYDWHVTNMKQYIHLSRHNAAARHYRSPTGKEEVLESTDGSGLLGLPGDFTSPSRFVRAAVMVNFMPPARTAKDAVIKAFHTMNNVQVINGTMINSYKVPQYTQWFLIKDLANSCIYFKSYNCLSVRKVCMENMGDEAAIYPINGEFESCVEDVSEKMKKTEK